MMIVRGTNCSISWTLIIAGLSSFIATCYKLSQIHNGDSESGYFGPFLTIPGQRLQLTLTFLGVLISITVGTAMLTHKPETLAKNPFQVKNRRVFAHQKLQNWNNMTVTHPDYVVSSSSRLAHK